MKMPKGRLTIIATPDTRRLSLIAVHSSSLRCNQSKRPIPSAALQYITLDISGCAGWLDAVHKVIGEFWKGGGRARWPCQGLSLHRDRRFSDGVGKLPDRHNAD